MRTSFYLFGKVYNLLLAVIGIPVNLVAIVILSRGKCGLSACTTRYLLAMAVADLLVIFTDAVLWRIPIYYFRGSFLEITPVCSTVRALNRAATDCSVWFTVTFTFDRFIAISCQKMRTKYCTERTATVVLATTSTLLVLRNIPIYFAKGPKEIIGNVPWGCRTRKSYYTEPGWMAYGWFEVIGVPLLPFILILLLNVLTVRHIVVASRVRKGLKGQTKGGKDSDPEMESRRRSMVLLFTLSGSFVLLWVLYVMYFLYYTITSTNPNNYNATLLVFEQVAFMLRNLNCCTNTFIYAVTQSRFREELKNVAGYPVSRCIQLNNNGNK